MNRRLVRRSAQFFSAAWNRARRSRNRHTVFLVLAVALFMFAAAPAAHAGDATMANAAALVSDAIVHAKIKSVIVFDFAGPDYEVTSLGRALADDFNASLEKSASMFSVESRSQISAAIANNQFALASENDGESTLALARDLKAKAFVMAQLSIDNDQLSVLLSCYRARDGKAFKSIRITSPLTEQEKKLLATDLTGFDAYPQAGKNGYSPPTCISCPWAPYAPKAMDHKIQGIVIMEAIIRADGTIDDIQIVKSLPDGLTQSAIATVKKWKLKPATGPDGKPAAVREIIQVQFQLF